MADLASTWKPLGTPAPAELTPARLQLHWAAQIATAFADAHVAKQQDDSHTNLEWRADRTLMVGALSNGERRARVALGLTDLTIRLLDAGGAEVAHLDLAGQTLEQALAWTAEALAAFRGASQTQPLELRDYDMPDHALRSGATFSAMADAQAELARWYSDADAALQAAVDGETHASPVRTWPHHFDIGALIRIDPASDAESARSIGLGLSPGDSMFELPYWYVYPWPRPASTAPPALPVGAWYTDDWYGAAMSANETIAGDGAAQAERVGRFLDTAIAAARAVLDR